MNGNNDMGPTAAGAGARACPTSLVGLIDAAGTQHAYAGTSARIVSLVPSLTELLFDLGLGDQLVGRTGFCVHPRDALRTVPKVGGTKDVRIERVRALSPTHVLVNMDENRRETVEELAAFVPNIIVTHPGTPLDNLALFHLLGGVFGAERAALQLGEDLRAALAEASALRTEVPDEAVLYLIWREPWMTVARDTYIAATLAAVGWHTLPEVAGGETGAARYPAFTWDAPWLLGVERVLLSTEPYRFRDAHIGEVAGLAGRPAALVDGEMVSWYGSRAARGVRWLCALRRSLAVGA
ncbi:helical backbone metal receptor [Thauera sp. WH-2]|jgi:ABC-type Fe3+-hydroxamate transport system substrate-binding protein|uniref:helical backbone metal receptor n=1 Tax=Thauera sp. WH-2 TaxID=3401574 RepID=UPI003AAB8033